MVKNYWYEQAGKASCSRLSRTELFCSGKGAKFDNTLSPRQRRIILELWLEESSQETPGNKPFSSLLRQWVSKDRVCLFRCLTVALLILARPLHGHLPSCWEHHNKVQRAKAPKNRVVVSIQWKNIMPSTIQTFPLETGSEVVSLTAHMTKKTLNYAACYFVSAYLWAPRGTSLFFLTLSLLCLTTHLMKQLSVFLCTALHFAFFVIPLATFYLPYMQCAYSPYLWSIYPPIFIYLVSLFLKMNAILSYFVSRKRNFNKSIPNKRPV